MEMCTLAAKSNTSLAQKWMLQDLRRWQFSTVDEAPLSKQTFRIISKLLCSGKNPQHQSTPNTLHLQKSMQGSNFFVTSKIMPIRPSISPEKTRTISPITTSLRGSTYLALPSFTMLPGSNPKFATAAGMAKIPAPTTSATMIPAVRKTLGRKFWWTKI